MNALQEFRFNTSNVRVVIINDDPWWVAKDVCTVLGISNVPDAVSSLDNDEKLVSPLPISGQYRDVNIINESGLYKLVFRSNKPEAKAFRKWVTSEVLPQIRKTGSYSVPVDPVDQVLLLAQKLTETALQVKEERSKNLALTHHIQTELQPKVDAWGEFLDCDGLIDLGYVAQVCKTGKNRLFETLRNAGVFYYQGKFNAIKQEYKNRGYFDIRFKPNKKLGNIPTIKCTPKGAEWIYTKFYRKEAA